MLLLSTAAWTVKIHTLPSCTAEKMVPMILGSHNWTPICVKFKESRSVSLFWRYFIVASVRQLPLEHFGEASKI